MTLRIAADVATCFFFGVDDKKAQESSEESEGYVRKICESKLGMQSISIQRAHRLGKFQSGKSRPLIANFTLCKENKQILHRAKKLKGSDVSISENFSKTVRTKRKFLRQYAQSRKVEGDKMSLRYDTLTMNGQKYVYDDGAKQVVPTTGPSRVKDVGLSFLLVNCTSIKNKVDDLNSLIETANLILILGNYLETLLTMKYFLMVSLLIERIGILAEEVCSF